MVNLPLAAKANLTYLGINVSQADLLHDQANVDETGTTFTSREGLHTIAYNAEYLHQLLRGFGFEATLHETGEYGYILHAVPLPFKFTYQPRSITNAVHREDVSHKLHEQYHDLPLKLCCAGMFLYAFYLLISEIIDGKPVGKMEGTTVAVGIGFLLGKLGVMNSLTHKKSGYSVESVSVPAPQ